MKAILVEDEAQSQVHLTSLLQTYCPEVALQGVATHLQEATELLYRVRPELLFLDIELGAQNGFDLLEASRHLSYSVIFTTAHEKYGVRAIKFSALDYLLKPVNAGELTLAVQKARQFHSSLGMQQQIGHLLELLSQKSGQEQSIAIPQAREIRFVQLSDILQIRAANNYSILYLSGGEQLTVSKGIYHFDKLLVPAGFLRAHQSHIVNPRCIRSIKTNDNCQVLQLSNGDLVPVSRLKLEMVKNTLIQMRC